MIELRLLREHHALHAPVDEQLPVHVAGKRIGTATVQRDGSLLVQIDTQLAQNSDTLHAVASLQRSIERD
jgi:hypothetical protein